MFRNDETIGHGGDRHSSKFRRGMLARRAVHAVATRCIKERVLAAVYTARFASEAAPSIAAVCRIAGCRGGDITAMLSAGLVTRVGCGRIRLTGRGKLWILESAGRDQVTRDPEHLRAATSGEAGEKGDG